MVLSLGGPTSSNYAFSIALNLVINNNDETTITYNIGDIAFVICAMALVFIMIPGVGFFYSGLLRRKNALSMIWASMLSTAVVSFQVPSSSFDTFHRTTEVNSMELVVLLGLFSRFLRRWRTIHRDSEYVICFSTTRFFMVNINMHRILRLAQRPRATGWPYSRFTVLYLSINVRCHNVCFLSFSGAMHFFAYFLY